METTVAGVPELTTSGRLVSAEEYAQRIERAAPGRRRAAHEDGLDALVGLGLPDETARRMSGYTGE
ncbi:hypothetical protein GCM10010503_38080 [Streptomyces lucensis JCM 4490]|uniref:Uncharacterized protein n=1 Tax=Streptomyces lucensis JCM 4490 TaxID=1306176 RepID=A0A918J7Z8_9ACTN|nr:hypothetical protein GCM10010503_38080 [Streptomyces lucensis JCM 4490]